MQTNRQTNRLTDSNISRDPRSNIEKGSQRFAKRITVILLFVCAVDGRSVKLWLRVAYR